MTHDGVEDTGCPLKVMHTSYAKRIPFFTGMHRFPACLDSFARRAGEADARKAFSTCGRRIEVSSVEPIDFAFSRLLRLSVDEETLY